MDVHARLLRACIPILAGCALALASAPAASAHNYHETRGVGPWTWTPSPYSFLTEFRVKGYPYHNLIWNLSSDNPHSYGVRPMLCDGTTAISTYKDRPAHDLHDAVALATDVYNNTCWRARVYSMYGNQYNQYASISS